MADGAYAAAAVIAPQLGAGRIARHAYASSSSNSGERACVGPYIPFVLSGRLVATIACKNKDDGLGALVTVPVVGLEIHMQRVVEKGDCILEGIPTHASAASAVGAQGDGAVDVERRPEETRRLVAEIIGDTAGAASFVVSLLIEHAMIAVGRIFGREALIGKGDKDDSYGIGARGIPLRRRRGQMAQRWTAMAVVSSGGGHAVVTQELPLLCDDGSGRECE